MKRIRQIFAYVNLSRRQKNRRGMCLVMRYSKSRSAWVPKRILFLN